MILSIDTARKLLNLGDITDELLKMKLDAIEQAIRAYTNNSFQNRGIRAICDISDGTLHGDFTGFSVGDTVQISKSAYSGGLHVVEFLGGSQSAMHTDGTLADETGVLVTKIEYPADVVACAANMLQWDVTNRGKIGIQSETLSRHSVTYFNMDGDNSVMGYPRSLFGCLTPYRKARC